VDAAVVLQLARLARLELSGSEVERSARDLTELLQDIAMLKEADDRADTPAGVLPAAPDGAGGGPTNPDDLTLPISSIAPEWRDGFFTVPRAVFDTAAAEEA
jgi:Asp-tRNA(Asn)/Glu-tRNA(Gln) amidotransferase C subunit